MRINTEKEQHSGIYSEVCVCKLLMEVSARQWPYQDVVDRKYSQNHIFGRIAITSRTQGSPFQHKSCHAASLALVILLSSSILSWIIFRSPSPFVALLKSCFFDGDCKSLPSSASQGCSSTSEAFNLSLGFETRSLARRSFALRVRNQVRSFHVRKMIKTDFDVYKF